MEHEITKYLARKKEKAANYEKKIKDLKREIDWVHQKKKDWNSIGSDF